MKKVELLAPAGSFEKAKTAFLYGADAVYCGTSSLSLRTRVGIDDEELAKTIEYAHSIGKKIYVALIRKVKSRWNNCCRWWCFRNRKTIRT